MKRILVWGVVILLFMGGLVVGEGVFDKIHDGMTYDQVGRSMGGVMMKGRMSKNFCGDIEIIQGKHRMQLSFIDGRLFRWFAAGMIPKD